MSSFEKGIEGEQQACDYLKGLGMRILCTRYRADGGEVDIIARKGDTLHFVEVKYRPHSRLGTGLAAIDEDKRKRLFRASKAYLKGRAPGARWQLDHLEITRAGVCLREDTARQS